MSETSTPVSEKETQPALFLPDGSPNPEVLKTLKKIEDEINREYYRRLFEDIEDSADERHRNHAP